MNATFELYIEPAIIILACGCLGFWCMRRFGSSRAINLMWIVFVTATVVSGMSKNMGIALYPQYHEIFRVMDERIFTVCALSMVCYLLGTFFSLIKFERKQNKAAG